MSTRMLPSVVGPYSHAVMAGEYLFCSGQIALHPETNELVGTDVSSQLLQILANLKQILNAYQFDVSQVVKTELYLTNMADFATVNEIYARFFTTQPLPARVTIAVAALPKGALVELSAVAYQKNHETRS